MYFTKDNDHLFVPLGMRLETCVMVQPLVLRMDVSAATPTSQRIPLVKRREILFTPTSATLMSQKASRASLRVSLRFKTETDFSSDNYFETIIL